MFSCEQYDYIEIICTYNYPLKLTHRSGAIIQGIAMDTKYNDAREECILLSNETETQLVVLDDIAILEVLVDNPHLNTVNFATSQQNSD